MSITTWVSSTLCGFRHCCFSFFLPLPKNGPLWYIWFQFLLIFWSLPPKQSHCPLNAFFSDTLIIFYNFAAFLDLSLKMYTLKSMRRDVWKNKRKKDAIKKIGLTLACFMAPSLKCIHRLNWHLLKFWSQTLPPLRCWWDMSTVYSTSSHLVLQDGKQKRYHRRVSNLPGSH